MKRKYFLLGLVLVLVMFLVGCGGIPTVPNQSPTASFTAIPTSGTVPLEVSFDASGSYDPDGNIISYAWDFKDGDTGSGETANHTFSSIGNYDVELTVTDNKGTTDSTTKNIMATEPIADEIVYRALCVGVGDYIYGDDDNDLHGPPYDVDMMIQIFNQCQFGPLNAEFSTINYLKDWQATKSNILQGIASTFSGADSDDVSYFYYTGHGGVLDNISYLLPTDYDGYTSTCISVSELESALSAIPGTKVVFLDTCHSGGFIGKGKGEITISQEELESFNDEVINVFSQAESKGLLTTNQYKVLASCHNYQSSWEIYPVVPGAFDPYGVFTLALCEGCGYSGSYPADTNLDTKVSLQEAYLYVRDWVVEFKTEHPDLSIIQDVQVYPENSTYPIVEY